MRGFLLDSHIWFWYLAGSERLPKGLRRAIDGAQDRCWLSPVSVWEIGMLAVRGRIHLQGDFRAWVQRALELFPVKDAPVNREVALTSLEVKLPHLDPADHFLAATALVYDLTLLTVDGRLSKVRWLATRSK